jgi:hypothetical protein
MPKSLYASCSQSEETELRGLLNLVTIKFLNSEKDCRFTVFVSSNANSLSVDYIAIREDVQYKTGNVSTWFLSPTKSGNYRFISRDGKSIEFFDTNFTEKKVETEYKMNMKHGVEIAWFKNGNIKSESHYINNLADGAETFWSESGKKVSERYFKNGLPDNNSKSKLSNRESNQESSQIELAKQKCLKLGFKEKTEKFGVCVLENLN